jgi:hypothetical protein
VSKTWDPDEGNDPGLPHPNPVVANGRIVPGRAGEPLRVLNPYSRFVGCVAATAGSVAGLVALEWRWFAVGLVVALGVTLAGPWVKP